MRFQAIRAWVKGVLEGVPGSNRVYETVRLIENTDELVEDFGTGVTGAGETQQRTHGWSISVTAVTPDEIDTHTRLDTYEVEATCYSSLYERGASEDAFQTHVATARDALAEDMSPAAIPDCYDVSPVTMELATVEFPIFSGRAHHRAMLRFAVRVIEPLRS